MTKLFTVIMYSLYIFFFKMALANVYFPLAIECHNSAAYIESYKSNVSLCTG